MKKINLNYNFYFEIFDNGEGSIYQQLGSYKSNEVLFTKEEMEEIRAAIPFEAVKPKEEMFKGCDND